jgi:hypothetical protein
MATNVNLNAPSSMGGKPSSPYLITMKFKPHATMTSSARHKSFNGMVFLKKAVPGAHRAH